MALLVNRPLVANVVLTLENDLFIAMATSTGKSHHAVSLAGRLGGELAFPIAMLARHCFSAEAAGAGMGQAIKKPLVVYMARKLFDRLFPAVAAGTGKGHNAFCLAGRRCGDHTMIKAVLTGDHFAAENTRTGVVFFIAGPLTAYMVGKLGQHLLIAMATNAGKGHHTFCLAGRLRCYNAIVIMMLFLHHLTAMDAGTGMLFLIGGPAAADMFSQLGQCTRIAVAAYAGIGDNTLRLAGWRGGHNACIIVMLPQHRFATMDALTAMAFFRLRPVLADVV